MGWPRHKDLDMYKIGLNPWSALRHRFRGISTENRYRLSSLRTSDALLQSRDWESLHDRTRRLRLHQAHLPKDLLLAGFGGRLDTSLDPAEAWESEDAVLLDLLGTKLSKARDDLACHILLDLELGSYGCGDGSLSDGLAGLHGLHGLHGRRHIIEGWRVKSPC